jgi:hypothetical protein
MTVYLDGKHLPETFVAVEGKTIELHCQAPPDNAKLKEHPHDQERLYKGFWDHERNRLVLQQVDSVTVTTESGTVSVAPVEPEAVPDKSLADVLAIEDPAKRLKSLETLAAVRGVKWDAKASEKTLVERVRKAAK